MEFLTLEEVAKFFRVNPRTILRWLKQGSLKGYKLGEGRTALLRIPKSEVKKFMAKYKYKT
ncbi:MAG: helix-turn-helix domain-containing protein [Candidatus Buchananbacteria bacterium]